MKTKLKFYARLLVQALIAQMIARAIIAELERCAAYRDEWRGLR